MKRLLVILAFTLGGLGLWSMTTVSPANTRSVEGEAAALQMETFAIENMTCALCPLTVRKALAGVAGVKSVIVDFNRKTATVGFDPAVTDAIAIGNASTNAGYPATASH